MKNEENPEPKKESIDVPDFFYQIEDCIQLKEEKISFDPLFFETLKARRSTRTFEKLTLQQISSILWHSLKAKATFLNGNQILSHRPHPSAGAIHPIDVFISLPESLRGRQLFYYDPFGHRLCKIKLNKQELELFFKNVNSCLEIKNATLIWFAAFPQRTATKYNNFESLIWRDAGAIMLIVQLVATALNINSCPIGTLGIPFFSKSFNTKLISAGGLLLG